MRKCYSGAISPECCPRAPRLTPDEKRTIVGLWSIARSPLFIGGNATSLQGDELALLLNSGVAAANSDAVLYSACLVSDDDATAVWTSVPSNSTSVAAEHKLKLPRPGAETISSAEAASPAPRQQLQLAAAPTVRYLFVANKGTGAAANITIDLDALFKMDTVCCGSKTQPCKDTAPARPSVLRAPELREKGHGVREEGDGDDADIDGVTVLPTRDRVQAGSYSVRDLWSGALMNATGMLVVPLTPAHGSYFYSVLVT